MIPIGLVAAEFGWAGGVTAAAASLGLFAIWNESHGLGAGPIGYLTRAVVFFGFAAAIGLLGQADPAPSRTDRDRQVNTPPRAFDARRQVTN